MEAAAVDRPARAAPLATASPPAPVEVAGAEVSRETAPEGRRRARGPSLAVTARAWVAPVAAARRQRAGVVPAAAARAARARVAPAAAARAARARVVAVAA